MSDISKFRYWTLQNWGHTDHRHTDVGIESIGSIKLIKDIPKVRYQTFQNWEHTDRRHTGVGIELLGN